MDKISLIRKTIATEFEQFTTRYEEVLHSENWLLNQVTEHIASHRGKQLRPLLTILAAKMCNPVTEKTILAAVALELLHSATLVHDDVVDNSPTRRGVASVNAQWGNKVAVLCGDYVLAKVIGLTAEIRNHKILTIVAQLGQMLSSGEILQLHAGSSMWIDEEQYMKIIEQKTAKLFEACAHAGAESAGCTQKQRTALINYGRLLGLCFQIKDDLLDYSDQEEIGKPTMNDLQDGKVTLPLIVALKRASEEEANHIKAIAEALARHEEGIDPSKTEGEIKSFILRYQGVEYAQQKMEQLRKEAMRELDVFRDPVGAFYTAEGTYSTKTALEQLFYYAINRMY